MSVILNIETSSSVCSVCLSKDGAAEFQLEDDKGMSHAKRLAPFVERCMEELQRKEWKLDAVAVSIGPGSYTGLRIGLSLAKGLCFSQDLPLIGVPTLEILAVKAMFRSMEWSGDEILIPMLDARRMEVYTAAYEFTLNALIEPQPMILDSHSYSDLPKDRLLVFMGDGSEKAKGVVQYENSVWLENIRPYARDMIALSEKSFRERKFMDLNYSVPMYLKEFQATVPKIKL